eukprot:34894_1
MCLCFSLFLSLVSVTRINEIRAEASRLTGVLRQSAELARYTRDDRRRQHKPRDDDDQICPVDT